MKTIELNGNNIVMVDDEDYEYLSQFNWMYKDNVNRTDATVYRAEYYFKRGANKKTKRSIIMSRVIMGATGWQVVHHKDGNPLNNQKSNLKLMTSSDHSKLHHKSKN